MKNSWMCTLKYNAENRRFYSSKIQQALHEKQKFKLCDPWFITGFIDGEGCFSITIFKSNTHKIGWQIKLEFKLNLHEKDKALLEQLQNYFSAGQIFKQGPEKIRFIVQSVKDLAAVINHFDQFSLLTKKFADYKLFKEAYNLIINQ